MPTTRTAMIQQASTLPKGDPKRRDLLARVQRLDQHRTRQASSKTAKSIGKVEGFDIDFADWGDVLKKLKKAIPDARDHKVEIQLTSQGVNFDISLTPLLNGKPASFDEWEAAPGALDAIEKAADRAHPESTLDENSQGEAYIFVSVSQG